MTDQETPQTPRWTCRRCKGGFPDPIKHMGRYKCPWCGEPLAKWAGDYGTRAVEGLMTDG